MKKKLLLMMALMSCTALLAGICPAADQAQDRERMQTQEQAQDMMQNENQAMDMMQGQDQQPIYGSQLMTEKERMEYRNRLRSAITDEERQQIRMEHHELMQERARAQGMMLPDEPPEKGMGKGRGMGSGGGMGYGGGMGQGNMNQGGMDQDNMGRGTGGGMGRGGGRGR